MKKYCLVNLVLVHLFIIALIVSSGLHELHPSPLPLNTAVTYYDAKYLPNMVRTAWHRIGLGNKVVKAAFVYKQN